MNWFLDALIDAALHWPARAVPPPAPDPVAAEWEAFTGRKAAPPDLVKESARRAELAEEAAMEAGLSTGHGPALGWASGYGLDPVVFGAVQPVHDPRN